MQKSKKQKLTELLRPIIKSILAENTGRYYIQTFQNGKQLLGSGSSRVLNPPVGNLKIKNAVSNLEASLQDLVGIKPYLKNGDVEIRVVDSQDKVIYTKAVKFN